MHVAAYVPDRAARAQLGFDYDACMRLHLPPCKLHPTHDALLDTMITLRSRGWPSEVFVYDNESRVTLYVEYAAYNKYEFSVITNIALIAVRATPEWLISPGSQERTLWYDNGHERHFFDVCSRSFTYFSESLPDVVRHKALSL